MRLVRKKKVSWGYTYSPTFLRIDMYVLREQASWKHVSASKQEPKNVLIIKTFSFVNMVLNVHRNHKVY